MRGICQRSFAGSHRRSITSFVVQYLRFSKEAIRFNNRFIFSRRYLGALTSSHFLKLVFLPIVSLIYSWLFVSSTLKHAT